MADDVFSKPPDTGGYSEALFPIDWNAFMNVVRNRRSVRVFDGVPLPEADVRDCLEAALLAPNSSNLQAWEFHWVRSPEKKAALVKACLSQPAARTASELIVAVARTGLWRTRAKEMLKVLNAGPGTPPASVVAYYSKLVPIVYEQGPLSILGYIKRVLFWIRGLSRPTPREPTSRAELRTWAVKSTALAAENLMLAMSAKGYDTCPMEGLDSNRVRRLLELPSDAVVTMAIACGRRAPGGVYGPRVRFDSSHFIKEV